MVVTVCCQVGRVVDNPASYPAPAVISFDFIELGCTGKAVFKVCEYEFPNFGHILCVKKLSEDWSSGADCIKLMAYAVCVSFVG